MNYIILMDKKLIGEGLYGKCYELSNGDILKIFKIPKDKSEVKKLSSFSKINLDSFVYPKELLVGKKVLWGYTMRKVPGSDLYSEFRNHDLNSAANNTINLERDIMLSSEMGIKMYDVHSENIFYDGKKYSVLDTDEYYYTDLDGEYLLYKNMKQFYVTFIELFIEELLNVDYLIKYPENFFQKIRSYKNKGYQLNQLIDLLKIEVENYFDYEINKLSDLEKIKRK